MTSTKIEELSKDAEELRRLSTLAERSKVKDVLLIETRKVEWEITRLKELQQQERQQTPADTRPASSHSANPNKCYLVKLTNYAWDQSGKFVEIFVDLKGVQQIPGEKVKCEFSTNEMKLSVDELNSRNYELTIKGLSHPIRSDTSHFKVKKDRVVVYLHKSQESKKWSSLTGGEKPVKKPDLEQYSDPTDGIMKMVKQIYDDGDDETKRSIAKAWVEGQSNKAASPMF